MFVVFIWWSCFLFSSSISDPLWGQRSHCESPGTPDGAKTSLRLEVLMPQPASCVIVWIMCEHRCVPACRVFSETQRRISGLCSLIPHFIPLRPVPSYWTRGWAGGHDTSAILAHLNVTMPSFLCGCWDQTSGLHSKLFDPVVPSHHLFLFCIFSPECLEVRVFSPLLMYLLMLLRDFLC